ncbi:MAG: glycine cleavage system protein GcvH [Actinobacteria bacterium]|nr:glycine cleavage system protein GcvH [Actinomycetota bacterium]
MSEGELPEGLRYTEDHEWTRDDGDAVAVGITWFAQDQLGDVVYVDLPSPGADVEKGQPFGEVESTKSVSDLFAPITGTIVERNEVLEDRPEVINEDPYGDGWLVTIAPADRSQLDGLLDAAAYRDLTS